MATLLCSFLIPRHGQRFGRAPHSASRLRRLHGRLFPIALLPSRIHRRSRESEQTPRQQPPPLRAQVLPPGSAEGPHRRGFLVRHLVEGASLFSGPRGGGGLLSAAVPRRPFLRRLRSNLQRYARSSRWYVPLWLRYKLVEDLVRDVYIFFLHSRLDIQYAAGSICVLNSRWQLPVLCYSFAYLSLSLLSSRHLVM